MMERWQRIGYELLHCTLYLADSNGYPTTVKQFVSRLLEIFPDIEGREITDACTRLSKQNALSLRLNSRGIFHKYRDEADDSAFFDGRFWLKPTSMSQT